MVAFFGAVLGLILFGGGVFLWARRRPAPAAPSPSRAPVEVKPPPESRPEALPPKQMSGLLRQVSDADIEHEIRSGRVFNAVRLYREQTGADAQEARSAVEAWRNRLTAS